MNNSVDILVASNRLGHANPSNTLDVYGHLLSSVQNEVADKMEKNWYLLKNDILDIAKHITK